METHSSAIVATCTTAATSVAEIEQFLSRRQSRQQRRCLLLMETTENLYYIKMNCWAKIGEKFDMSAADAEKKI